MVAFFCFVAIINFAWLLSDISTVSSWAVKRQIMKALLYATHEMIPLQIVVIETHWKLERQQLFRSQGLDFGGWT